MSIPRLYVPGLDPGSDRISLPEGEAHHVTRVLRAKQGDTVRVFDGRGGEWTARLVSGAGRSAVGVEIVERTVAVPEAPVRATLAAGILKGDHMDAVIRDATMMGVAEIIPLVIEHVDVPKKAWGSKAALERWQRVAIAAAKQSGRAVVPEILAPSDLETVLANDKIDTRLMFVEPAISEPAVPVAELGPPPRTALLLIGPEGGWSPADIRLAKARDCRLVRLGPRTIRGDAMAAVAFAALWAVWRV